MKCAEVVQASFCTFPLSYSNNGLGNPNRSWKAIKDPQLLGQGMQLGVLGTWSLQVVATNFQCQVCTHRVAAYLPLKEVIKGVRDDFCP